jgi:hypothetical protein
MKKLLLSLALSTTVLFTGSALASGIFNTSPAKITPGFASVINNAVKNSSNLEEYYHHGYKAWKFKYSSALNSQLSNLSGKTGNTSGIQSVTTDFDYDLMVQHFSNESPYQCVGFAKIASNIDDEELGHPTNWVKGEQITPSNLPPQGTVIATFFDNDTYQGHVAIFVSGNSNRIYVVDQNSQSDGEMKYHAIPFNNGSRTVHGADNYYVVEH